MTPRDLNVTRLSRVLHWAGLLVIIVAVAAGLVVHAPNARAATAATAAPNSGLHDQQVIRVTASGFPANTTLNALECAHGALSSAECEGATNDATVQTDVNGNYDNSQFTVYVLPDSTIKHPSITCDKDHACDLLVAVDYNDFTQPKAFTPITFADAAPTSSSTTTTTRPAATSSSSTTARPGGPPSTSSTTSTAPSSGSSTTSTTAAGSSTTTPAACSASATTSTTATGATTSTSGSSTTSSSTSTTVSTGGSVTQVPSDTGSITAAPNDSVTVAGKGFTPTTDLAVTVCSDPISLGTTKSDATGAYNAKVTIPSSLPAGDHLLVVSGPAAGGGTLESVTKLTVTAAAGSGSGSGSGANGSAGGSGSSGAASAANGGGGSLASTSMPVLAPWLAALGVVIMISGSVARRLALRPA